MSERYRVPKRRVQVQIQFPHLGANTVYLFLSDRAESHVGKERPSDLFNGSSGFVAVQNERAEVALLQCSSVSVVTVPMDSEFDKESVISHELVESGLETEARASVQLDDGSVLEGCMRYQLPEAQGRLVDYLNQGDRFLPLHQGNEVSLINKRRIARVTPL